MALFGRMASRSCLYVGIWALLLLSALTDHVTWRFLLRKTRIDIKILKWFSSAPQHTNFRLWHPWPIQSNYIYNIFSVTIVTNTVQSYIHNTVQLYIHNIISVTNVTQPKTVISDQSGFPLLSHCVSTTFWTDVSSISVDTTKRRLSRPPPTVTTTMVSTMWVSTSMCNSSLRCPRRLSTTRHNSTIGSPILQGKKGLQHKSTCGLYSVFICMYH